METALNAVPFVVFAGFLGYCIGYGNARRLRAEHIIATSPESDLLKEVKRRRLEERLTEEVDKQVEKEAGARPVIPY